MLSISPLKSASGAAKYYLTEENPKDLPDVSLEKDVGDNYYLKEKGQGEKHLLAWQAGHRSGTGGKARRASLPRVGALWQPGGETIKGNEMIINRAST
ncbi:hypothetical protein BCU30_026175 [Vibrio lentus]|uniref:hypothetical protein n=1 Tax=Vibrio lentus TaxID=136468 RepID=UPI0039A4D90D